MLMVEPLIAIGIKDLCEAKGKILSLMAGTGKNTGSHSITHQLKFLQVIEFRSIAVTVGIKNHRAVGIKPKPIRNSQKRYKAERCLSVPIHHHQGHRSAACRLDRYRAARFD